MSDYASTIDLRGLAERLLATSRVMVCSHAKPDGDAIGSCLAVRRILGARGVEVEIVLCGAIEPALLSVVPPDAVTAIEASRGQVDLSPLGDLDRFDAIVVVDTGTFPQLEPLAEVLRPRRDRIVGIDHHARGDVAVAATRYVDSSAASTTEILAAWAPLCGVTLDSGGAGSIAEAIFVGLATDTGWFRFPSAGPRQFLLAARLLGVGVEKDRLYAQLEQQGRPQRLQLLGRALASMRTVAWGGDQSRQVAVMTLARRDYEETGGLATDTSGLVNEPLALAGVVGSVLLTEAEPGTIRLSFRSSGAAAVPEGEAECRGAAIDVNQLAARFGGGGHVAAAGARLQVAMTDAVERVVAEIARG